MTISYTFLISGQDWSTDIEDLKFNFASETPSYLYFQPLFYNNYEVFGDDGLEFSGYSNLSTFDQMMTILEAFLHRAFVLEDIGAELEKQVPKRPKKK
jgi:hypothetical protein